MREGSNERDLALAMLWRLPPRWLRRMIEHVGDGRLPFPWTARDLDLLGGRFPAGIREILLDLPSAGAVARARQALEASGIRLLTRGTDGFPEELAGIPDPPPFLFVRGEPLSAGWPPRVAVIGSRAASATGREIACALARDLALAGVEVVSGMARGIDGEAHRGALEADGRTIAVLGTGADVCYPPEHRALFQGILRKGGVVTEFPPGIAGLPLHFPRRNRILTALAQAVVVVEGGERSGARSSVDHALEQGREVLAVPRDIVHPGSALPNRLIRDGARPVLGVRDVLEALHGVGSPAATAATSPATTAQGTPQRSGTQQPLLLLDPLERRLLEALRGRTRDLAGCERAAPGTDAGALQAALLRLEVMGWITRLPGGRFAARDAKWGRARGVRDAECGGSRVRDAGNEADPEAFVMRRVADPEAFAMRRGSWG